MGVDLDEVERLARARDRYGHITPEVVLSLAAELRALRRFAGFVFSAHRNDGYPGDVDGGEIQQWALECGLIEERQMFEPCSGHCTCAEICDWPTTCYFDTALGKAVRKAALERQQEKA
jgi:hypothetical protein